MRLVACQNCHTQYDVTDVGAETFKCRCGETVENRDLTGVDAKIYRCGSCGALVGAEATSCDYCGSEIVRDDKKLSLICPECNARNAEASRFCTACGVAFQPEAVKTDGYELPCPVCGCLMPAHSIGGIGVNECPTCNGIWAPGDHLDQLIDRAIEAHKRGESGKAAVHAPRVKGGNPMTSSVKYRKCPECDAYMQRRNFRRSSGVIIDSCRKHGTWLDADELEEITGFVVSGGRPVAEKMLEDADRQAAEAVRNIRLAEFTGGSAGWTRSTRPHGGGNLLGGTIVSVLKGLLD